MLYKTSVMFGKANDSVHMHFPSKKTDNCSLDDDKEKTPLRRERQCRTAIWYHTCGNRTIPCRDVTRVTGGCVAVPSWESDMVMAMVYASGVVGVRLVVVTGVQRGTMEMARPPPFSVRIRNKSIS